MAIRSVGYGVRKDAAPTLQWFRASLLVVMAFCTYLHVPYATGGRVLVPSFPTVVLTPLLFLTVRPNLSRSDEVFLPKIAFVLLLSIALSPGYAYVGEKFFGLIQCCMAIAVAVLIVRLMQQLRPEMLERALLVFWCLIVGGAILEVLGVIREISDSFRAWAYLGTYTLVDNDLRDINLVGWPRPKLFSPEPSHVTKVFIASINSWLLVRVSSTKAVIVAGATLVMLVIMGSPMLFGSAAITLAILVWNRRASIRIRLAMVLAALLFSGLFGAFYAESTFSNVTARIENIGDSARAKRYTPSSEDQRLVYPYLTLVDTWSRWPLFGVGIGGKEVVMEHTTFKLGDPIDALGNNAMAEFGIYLGLVGGAWFIYLLLMQASQTGVERLGLMLVIGTLISQLNGGVESFRYWGFVALFWGALAVADAGPRLEDGPVFD
jgi:hypothetical protein